LVLKKEKRKEKREERKREERNERNERNARKELFFFFNITNREFEGEKFSVSPIP
jgi:hypothetical protein